jgi:prolyl-tRNA synthetase
MRYSQLFAKTRKNVSQENESINARLLTQAGFVDQEMAGVYTWLPLGWRTLRKVEQIVREEMDALGAQEIFMPSLQPKEYWTTTNRWDNVDILFKLKSQTEKEYALGCSHEEVVTPLVQKFVHSYKELPCATYQINTKFRDELRAKSGVLRGREFRMKDMYSFHATQEDLTAFYNRVLVAYVRAYQRCGLNVKVVQASGGIFTENISHEFQALTDAGEDLLIACERCEFGQNSEVATYKVGEVCPKCGGILAQMKGVEVGNIFDLGTKYSNAFGFNFMNEKGEQQPVLMGCYGIGVSRLVGAIVEVSHDERGMIWPMSVAPFHVQLVSLRAKEETMQTRILQTSTELYEQLRTAGVEVLWDDRVQASPGEKLADADLFGTPLRVLISEKTLSQEGKIEVKQRSSEEAILISQEEVLSWVLEAKQKAGR